MYNSELNKTRLIDKVGLAGALTGVRHAPLEAGDVLGAGDLLRQHAGAHHGVRLKAGTEFPLDGDVDDAGEVDQSHLNCLC